MPWCDLGFRTNSRRGAQETRRPPVLREEGRERRTPPGRPWGEASAVLRRDASDPRPKGGPGGVRRPRPGRIDHVPTPAALAASVRPLSGVAAPRGESLYCRAGEPWIPPCLDLPAERC